MKNVTLLAEILDPKFVDKLVYLDRIIKLYCKFAYTLQTAKVTTNGEMITILFTRVTLTGHKTFFEVSYPLLELQKHIASYKRILASEFKNRHSNQKFITEKLKRKEEKENAEIRMSEQTVQYLRERGILC